MGRRREHPVIPPEVCAQLLSYDPETGEFRWRDRPDAHPGWNARRAGKPALTYVDFWGYRVGRILGQNVKAHRAAWAIHFGAWPDVIDHINGDKLDNRIANLRNVSATENARNAALSVRNKSGTVGVCFTRQDRKWVAHIGRGGRGVILGRFGTKAEAVAARKYAEVREGYHPNHGKNDARG